jgi:septum site-determining protein MinC
VAQSFEIKSAQLPLVALLLKTANLQQVIDDLVKQFGGQGESPDFFDNDPLVIDFSQINELISVSAFQALVDILKKCKLKPIAFRAANSEILPVAVGIGLIEAPPELTRTKTATKSKPLVTQRVEVIREVVKEVVREIAGPSTLVIDKPLRSGQKIYARGADLVVLAMVNMGAEVVADGNIHVYAPLRGKAMAGASGNTQARIFSLCLEPELISIAGIYRTSENPLSADIQGKPAQVRLSNDGQDKLLFEALNP